MFLTATTFYLMIIRKIIKWVVSLFLLVSGGYYAVCKFVLHIDNDFVLLIDKIVSVIGIVLNFLAQHILAVLIVVFIAVILVVIYKVVVYKNSGDKE